MLFQKNQKVTINRPGERDHGRPGEINAVDFLDGILHYQVYYTDEVKVTENPALWYTPEQLELGWKFYRGQKVLIRTDDGDTIEGVINKVIQGSRTPEGDPTAIAAMYIVTHRMICPRRQVEVDTVTRFHERVNGVVFTSRRWKLEAA